MSDVFHRQTRTDPPVAVRGEGLYIVDAEGRRYLDASGGAAVSCVGHGHPAVVAAIREQAGALAYSHTSFFTSRPAEELGARLVADARRWPAASSCTRWAAPSMAGAAP